MTSRFSISQYSWFLRSTASSTNPSPLTTGLTPPPYVPTRIGCPSVPEPLGQSCPRHTELERSKIVSQGRNVVALTFSSVLHAAPGAVPVFASLPSREST